MGYMFPSIDNYHKQADKTMESLITELEELNDHPKIMNGFDVDYSVSEYIAWRRVSKKQDKA